MAELADIRALYEAYIAQAEQLERDRKPGEGIFGLKNGPADDPCHDRFAAELEGLIGAFAAQSPPPEQVRAALDYIYSVQTEHREPKSVYWMLCAVHGLALPLIGALAPADAAALREQYAQTFPRWERLPVQKKTLDALRARQKEK